MTTNAEKRKRSEDILKTIQDLVSVINEEVGELTKATNDILFKDNHICPDGTFAFGTFDRAWEELRDIFPPLVELYNVLRFEK